MLAETNILQFVHFGRKLTDWIFNKREIILPLNKKFIDFCQIEPGIHSSTIPS